MRARGVGLGSIFSYVLTRSSAREHSGLNRWEAEGGALATDAAGPAPQVALARNPAPSKRARSR
jgi:hypothetical protein